MHHAYFGKIRINESQGKYCIEAPSCNPFKAQLELNKCGWIFFGDIKDVLSLIASVGVFRSINSGNVTALVTSHRLIDTPFNNTTSLMSYIMPREEVLCEQLGIPISMLEIGRSRFSEWCSVTFMGSHPMQADNQSGIAVHWMQGRIKGPSAAGAIAEYFRQITHVSSNDLDDKRVYRAIGGHLLPNLS